MSETHDGGPAFPRSDGGYSVTQDGMSLRDWFAGQALAGLLANEARVPRDLTAGAAYSMADAMLAARQKGDTP